MGESLVRLKVVLEAQGLPIPYDKIEAHFEQTHSVKTHTIVASLLAALAIVGAGVALYAAYAHHSSINDLSLEDYTQMGTSLLIGGALAAYLIFAYFLKPKHNKKIKGFLALVLLTLAGLGVYYSGLYDGFKGKDWDHSALVLTGGALTGFSVVGIIGLLYFLNLRKKARIYNAMSAERQNDMINLLDVLSFEEDEEKIKEYFKKTLTTIEDNWDMGALLRTPQNDLRFPLSPMQEEKIKRAFRDARIATSLELAS